MVDNYTSSLFFLIIIVCFVFYFKIKNNGSFLNGLIWLGIIISVFNFFGRLITYYIANVIPINYFYFLDSFFNGSFMISIALFPLTPFIWYGWRKKIGKLTDNKKELWKGLGIAIAFSLLSWLFFMIYVIFFLMGNMPV